MPRKRTSKKTSKKGLWLETKRNVFHLVFGCALAVLVLMLGKEQSMGLFGFCLLFGILISKLLEKRKRVPFFSWFIRKFEREEVMPGGGVVSFFMGSFLAIALFGPYTVFVALLILAFLDSFSTIVGLGFGKRKVRGRKTVEGFFAGFMASFLVASLFIPLYIALFACFIASLIEVASFGDDNIFIPPIASMIIWGLRTL